VSDQLVISAPATTHGVMRDAYEQLRAEAASLPGERVRPVRIDVPGAYSVARYACPRLAELRSELAAMPGFDLQRFDRLPLYARAAMHAHVDARITVGRDRDLTKLAALGFALRNQLLASARLLVPRKIIHAEVLKKLHRPSGYAHLASDLMVLAQVYRNVWSQIDGSTLITAQDLADANRIADEIYARAGARKRTPEEIRAARAMRDRMFTLFVEAYEDTRIAVQYLRRNTGDADKFAPPLTRRKRKKKSKARASAGSGMVVASV
jgi:hypothetical protein